MCYIRLLEEEEAQLAAFEESKRALDIRTHQLHRSKLHPLLRESGLSDKMASLCRTRNDFSHLDVADQRLLSMMPLNNEGFADAELKESTYNVSLFFFFFARAMWFMCVCMDRN